MKGPEQAESLVLALAGGLGHLTCGRTFTTMRWNAGGLGAEPSGVISSQPVGARSTIGTCGLA